MHDKISTLGPQRLDIFFENSASDTQGIQDYEGMSEQTNEKIPTCFYIHRY